ncbi:MAG: septum formation initiator family protein [Pseudomonadota bacterium]
MPLRGLWWPLVLAAAVLVSGVTLGRGFANLHQLREELNQVRQTNQRLDRENRAMYRLALRLRGEGEALERVVRQEAGLVRPGELVYQLGPGQGQNGKE